VVILTSDILEDIRRAGHCAGLSLVIWLIKGFAMACRTTSEGGSGQLRSVGDRETQPVSRHSGLAVGYAELSHF
jgi:hypothetical protein